MDIIRQPDKESAAAEAGEYLNSLLLENKKQPVLLMLSGGSALSMLDYVGTTALGENLTVSALDERFSNDAEINNFSQIQKTDFYKLALDAGASFFGTLPRPDDTIETLAKRWEANLREWKKENPSGIIVATLGMGPDGHTSGIMPYPEDADKFRSLFQEENWLVAYNADSKNSYPQRVTTTLTFLRLINYGFAFVSGTDKKPKLDDVIKKQGEVHKLPALAWHDIADLKIFTDIA